MLPLLENIDLLAVETGTRRLPVFACEVVRPGLFAPGSRVVATGT